MEDPRGSVMFGSEVELNGALVLYRKPIPLQPGYLDDFLQIPFLDKAFGFSCKDTYAKFFWLNGGLVYKDSIGAGVIELASPEVKTAKDLVIYEQANLSLAEQWVKELNQRKNYTMSLFKNNCYISDESLTIFRKVSRLEYEETEKDYFSTGYHQNYLVADENFFCRITEDGYCKKERLFKTDEMKNLITFLITSEIFTGAGLSLPYFPWFLRSQKSWLMKNIYGEISTRNRPFITKKDSLVGNNSLQPNYGRLHIVSADSNMSEHATFLKFITTSLVLGMLRQGAMQETICFADPLATLRESTSDLTCRKKFNLEDGRKLSFLEVQRIFLNNCFELYGKNASGEIGLGLDGWKDSLDRIEAGPLKNAGRILDWAIKYNLMTDYCKKKNLNWIEPRVRVLDLQYHNINKEKGLYYLLLRQDRIDRITTDTEVESAKMCPPVGTRGGKRGKVIQEAIRRNLIYTSFGVWTKLYINCEKMANKICTGAAIAYFDDVFDDNVDDVIEKLDATFGPKK